MLPMQFRFVLDYACRIFRSGLTGALLGAAALPSLPVFAAENGTVTYSSDTTGSSPAQTVDPELKQQMLKLREDYARLQSESAQIREQQRAQAGGAPDALKSAGGNATVRIGGEMNTDYIVNWRSRSGQTLTDTSWNIHNSNLRFTIDLSPELQGRIKLDLSEKQPYLRDQILEEAQIVWKNISGGPFSVLFGKGEVPYGQDRTLGIIQSYHHTEGSYSPEGPTILNGPQEGAAFNDQQLAEGPVYHPGEVDRVVMAGVNFDWEDTIKAEFAVFQPNDWRDPALGDGAVVDGDVGIESFAGRIWWKTPVEGMVAEVSGIRQHIRQRGDNSRYGSDAVEDEYAASAGLDWNLPGLPLELFGEYEHGWDWNYTSGYNTDTLSFGGLYGLTDRLRAGGMAEWLLIDDRGNDHNYNKFVLHTDYTFRSGLYLMAEYGLEFYNWSDTATNTFAMRTGIRF